MTIDNWIAVSAGVTFLLAIAAFWAIWQNYTLHKKERKERLLNEIIEWATDAAKCEVPIGTTAMAGIIDAQSGRAITRAHMSELASKCAEIILRGRYISEITSKPKFGQNLNQAIVKLIKDLEKRIELLGECDNALSIDSPNEFEKVKARARGHWLRQVRESIHKVIEEAAKIKTRDIG